MMTTTKTTKTLLPLAVALAAHGACLDTKVPLGASADTSTGGDALATGDVDDSTHGLEIAPRHVDFGDVDVGAAHEATVSVRAIGVVATTIVALEISADEGFEVVVAGHTLEGRRPVVTTSSSHIVLEPDQVLAITIRYHGPDIGQASGELVLHTDAQADGERITFGALGVGRCAMVTPAKLYYRTPIGQAQSLATTLLACGTEPVSIQSVALVGDTAGMFAIENGPAGQVLQPAQSMPIAVRYTPTSHTPGSLHEATLRVTTSGHPAVLDVVLEGTPIIESDCPQAVITCVEGAEVEPQTTLHCSGTDSVGRPGRQVVGYAWTIKQPDGSVEVIRPSSSASNIQFTANIVGHYALELTIYDESGAASCVPAAYRFVTLSSNALHVELLWHTPGDDDESDAGSVDGFSVGSDMDLHVLEGDAAWFDSWHDAFWLNPNPNWVGPGSADDPSLDRDDTDGAGPENLNYDLPTPGTTYTVGVHYWDDWGYGMSTATVRIYVQGQLRWEGTTDLVMGDLWEVATIAWPAGTITPIPPAPHIIPDFAVPLGAGWP